MPTTTPDAGPQHQQHGKTVDHAVQRADDHECEHAVQQRPAATGAIDPRPDSSAPMAEPSAAAATIHRAVLAVGQRRRRHDCCSGPITFGVEVQRERASASAATANAFLRRRQLTPRLADGPVPKEAAKARAIQSQSWRRRKPLRCRRRGRVIDFRAHRFQFPREARADRHLGAAFSAPLFAGCWPPTASGSRAREVRSAGRPVPQPDARGFTSTMRGHILSARTRRARLAAAALRRRSGGGAHRAQHDDPLHDRWVPYPFENASAT